MGLGDFFKKRSDKSVKPRTHLDLHDMVVGCFVDYDLKTWEVTACNQYDWGEGDISWEWQLKSADEVAYLELEKDDEDSWSFNHKIPFDSLDPQIKSKILDDGDPPEEIRHEDCTYYLEETAAGHFRPNGKGDGKPMLRWGFEDDEGNRYLGIEQWGEKEFEASSGIPVEAYQFINILPAPGELLGP